MSTRKPKLKSKKKRRKPHAKLGWGEGNRNFKNLKRLEKSNQDEEK